MEKKSNFGKIVFILIIFIIIILGILIMKQSGMELLPNEGNTEETSGAVKNMMSESNIKNEMQYEQSNIVEPV